eukprot:9454_1
MEGSDGISRLLAAEDSAAEIVRQAREYRITRLKQAKEAAESEIEKYRETLQRKFDAEAHSKVDESGDFTKELEESTHREISNINYSYELWKDQVVGLLLHHVTTVDTNVPKTLSQGLKATS